MSYGGNDDDRRGLLSELILKRKTEAQVHDQLTSEPAQTEDSPHEVEIDKS